MILVHALRQLFPDADFENDILLQNDGEGDYIKEWNLPDPQPSPAELESAWQQWVAGESGREQKRQEIEGAPLTAIQYFASKPAAIAFIRLTPAEQEAQIEAMTLAQLKAVVKYLTIAVSAVVKREFL